MRKSLSKQLKLYFVMGSQDCNSREPETVLREALEGGVTMVQFREKGPHARQGEEKLALGRKLRELCRSFGVPFIVNDEVDLAEALKADGLHVGQEDLQHYSIADIRERLGNDIWLGISAHDVQEALAADRIGADYLGVGPMYPTATKQDTRPVTGPDALAHIREFLPDMPIVGIGGIDEHRIAPVLAAGADGVAVVSAISHSTDPRQKAEMMLGQIHDHL